MPQERSAVRPSYVPIIKWQKWEQRALKKLDAEVVERVLPCLEIRDSKQHRSLIADLHSIWPHQVMIDYANPAGTLTEQRRGEFEAFCEDYKHARATIIPVINPADLDTLRKPEFIQLLSSHNQVAYRLRASRFNSLSQAVEALKIALSLPRVPRSKRLLIVDLGVTPRRTATYLAKLKAAIIECTTLGFEHIYVASGSYPESLAAVSSKEEFERKDWKLWRALDKAIPDKNVGYSDYGVLSPNWSEETLIRRGSRVVIRYTCRKNWLILRGANAQKPESIALSVLMVTVYADKFMGADFSYGDKLIADRADDTVPERKKKGGHTHIAEGWSHHITFVVRKQYREVKPPEAVLA